MFRASAIARSVVGVLVSSESMHSSVTVPVLSAAAVNSAHFFRRHSSPDMNPPKCSNIVQRSRERKKRPEFSIREVRSAGPSRDSR
ncbi:MAG: hypothetical protein BWX50_00880 [Euryarchaeota archaeon ADurb.Bin009]|nr:MAG: hypothetical protein BWX50_00880 [Euryarchaeota archaeon ADurb.Bin009]